MRHLTESDRKSIEQSLKKQIPVAKIAEVLGFHRSTIYKEIKKGTFLKLDSSDLSEQPEYGYDVGQRKYDALKHNKGRKKKLAQDDVFLQQVKNLIVTEKYSPEAVCYRVKTHPVCVKTIYNYIHAGYIPQVTTNLLPYAKNKKKKKNKVVKREFKRGVSIEQRPEYVNKRQEYGHWEMDTVYSSRDDKTCLLVLSERMTREELIFRIKDRTTVSVIRALDRYERKIGTPAFCSKFLTITCDNGMEFANWEKIEKSCRTKGRRTVTYFCHPYCSGERGTNENTNKMIRRWIPKGDDIGLYSAKEIEKINKWINSYPRGIFGGLSAKEFLATL